MLPDNILSLREADSACCRLYRESGSANGTEVARRVAWLKPLVEAFVGHVLILVYDPGLLCVRPPAEAAGGHSTRSQ